MEEVDLFSFAAFTSAAISLALVIYTWTRRRDVPAAPSLALVMAGLTVWSLAYGLELSSATLAAKVGWAQLAYVGVEIVPGAWLACVRRYAGQPPLSRRAVALLACEPLLALALVWSNAHHHRFWTDTALATAGARTQLVASYGIGAWANVAYSYVLMSVSTILLVQKVVRSPRVYRVQSAVLLAGVAAPWVSHISYVLGYHPVPGLELTSFAFVATGLAMAFALFRLGLFEVMPVAQSAIVERIHDGIVVINAGGLVVHVNPAAEAMLGVEESRVVGRPALETFGGVAELAGRFAGVDVDGEVAIGTGDRQRIFDVRVSGLDGARGESRRIVVLRDVTAAKRAELALLLARDEAVAAARSKADFLATMSHEIRTPMNGVIGATELLLSTRLSDDQLDLARTIRGSANALLGIIDSILDFSKIEAGRVELEQVDFDLRHMVEEVVDLFGPRARNQGLELIAAVDADVPPALHGDGGRLRQVLTNLVANAIKFTPKGSVTVSCQALRREDNRFWLRLGVSDTGIGIEPDQQQRLFEPFVQADSSTTRRYGGTGLGLAICKRLVELMGGEIGLESQPGKGTTFRIAVPFDLVTEKHEAAAARPNLRGESILLLDARSATRRALEGHLKGWGASVDTAEQAAQAIAILRSAARQRRPFGWLFVDLHAAGAETVRLLYSVRAETPLRGMRVVLLTDVGCGEDLEDLRARGLLNATLLKPLRESRLRQCVADLLAGVGEWPAEPDHRGAVAPAARPSPRAEASALPGVGASAAFAPSPELLRPPTPRGSGGEPARILVVEDNVVNRKVAIRMLSNLGHAVDVAENGRQAIEAMAERDYDLILMDCQMPVMDGFQATEEIRRHGTGHQVIIVAMTANAMEGDRERCLQAGMNDYISKPVRPADLAAVLQRWLPNRPEAEVA